MVDFEKLGVFYLGRHYDPGTSKVSDDPVLYDSKDLVTHALIVGMTGSGKTGLGVALIEEAAIDGVPVIVIDPKGDLTNLLLTFPKLLPADFEPWVDEDEARRAGKSTADFAADQAARWKKGLADWGEDGARIQKLRDTVDMAIYTPGSTIGTPVSVLRSFTKPDVDDDELLRERVQTTISSVLALAGIDAEPVKSREHILLSTILLAAWQAGESPDLATLIQRVQQPPMTRIGVMDVDSFFPQKDRFAFAMSINTLLASPGFAVWTQGEPLDVAAFLRTPRRQTARLDFHAGASRRQPADVLRHAAVERDDRLDARPIGHLEPARHDLHGRDFRLLPAGGESAVQAAAADAAQTGPRRRTWASCWRRRIRSTSTTRGCRTSAPGGWAGCRPNGTRRACSTVSRGRMPAASIARRSIRCCPGWRAGSSSCATCTRKATCCSSRAGRCPICAVRSAATRFGSSPPDRKKPAATAASSESQERPPSAPSPRAQVPGCRWRDARPMLPPDVPQYFTGLVSASRPLSAVVYGAADVRFTDTRLGVDVSRVVTLMAAVSDSPVPLDWQNAERVEIAPDALQSDAPDGATYAMVPAAAAKAKNYAVWSKQLGTWLSGNEAIELMKSPSSGEVSNPDESERDFRARLQHTGRESRDGAVEALRKKYGPKQAALEEKLRRAKQTAERESQQATGAKLQVAISAGATIMGALFGRKAISASTIGRATTVARGVGRTMKESEDTQRAEETVAAIEEQQRQLEADLAAETAALDASSAAATEKFDRVALKPKKGNVNVKLVALVWR